MSQHPQGDLLSLLAQPDVTKIFDPTQPVPEMGGIENLILNLLSGIVPQFAQSAAGLQPQRPSPLLALAAGGLVGLPKSAVTGVGKAALNIFSKNPSGIFRGASELGEQGLKVFARSEGPGMRSVVSITPNPKPGGGWKVTTFDEVAGKGTSLGNVVEFETREAAIEAVSGGRAFFRGFKEVPLGSESKMEDAFEVLFNLGGGS